MKKTPWIMLGLLLVTQIAVAFVGRSVGPLAPFLQDGFQLSKAQVGLLPSSLFVGQSLVSIPAGWYADRLGTKKMILILSATCGTAFLLMSFSLWYVLVLLGIMVGGFGYGAMHPTSNRGIINWFPQQLAGTAMGIKQMGVTTGSALAALILLPLALQTSWRFAMALAACLLLAVGFCSFLFYRDPPSQKVADKAEKPLFLPTIKTLLQNKPLVGISLAAMFLTSAQLSLTTYIVFYVSESLLYSLILAAVFLSVSEISGSLGRIVWGIVSDRLFNGQRSPVLIMIAGLTAVCSAMTAFLPPHVSLWILTPIVIVFGFCIAGFNGLWMNFASETVSREFAGVASGFSLTVGSLGVVLGAPIFGAIVDLTGGYRSAWLSICIEMTVVIGLLLFVGKEMRQTKQSNYSSSSTI